MSWDIYGQPLKGGHCEVHPDVHESYPCSLCYAQREREQMRQREHDEYMRAEREAYYEEQRQAMIAEVENVGGAGI